MIMISLDSALNPAQNSLVRAAALQGAVAEEVYGNRG
jgi:hypothetical protein